MSERDPAGSRHAWLWATAFAVVAALLVVRNLIDLSGSPPGLYIDESSIGYNAWTVAHYGVDEHGVHVPLFFAAFGEYKNPVYIYSLVPLARFLALTPTVERLPAAMFGLFIVAFLTMAAWRMSRSRPITLFALGLSALTPWITQQSRVGFEVVSMVALLSGALWCLADEQGLRPRRLAGAGLFLGLAIYGYTVGRFEVLALTVAFVAVYARRRFHQWWLALVPVIAGYAVLAVYGLLHPGALTSHFNGISIASPNASPITVAGRFLANYGLYFTPDFLFIHGDPNPRHNTGYAGMLLAVMVPLLLMGLVTCWRRRSEALPKIVLLGIVLAPVAAAVTDNGGAPHALRSATAIPFWMLLAFFGLVGIADLVRGRRVITVAVVAAITAALLAQGAFYTVDLYTAYPVRAAAAFDTGEVTGLAAAAAAAGGHTIYVSDTLEQPYIDAFFALTPPPPATPVDNDGALGLDRLGMRVSDPADAEAFAAPGDLLVLWITDPRPRRAVVIGEERAPVDPLHPGGEPPALVMIYRAT